LKRNSNSFHFFSPNFTHSNHNTLQYININGKLTDIVSGWIPIDNGAFRYGYGLFETMFVQKGNIALKEYHMERLFAGMEQLLFTIPALMNPLWMEEQVLKTVNKNKLEKLCRLRLQVFAGGGGLFGAHANQPGFVIECFELNEDIISLNENGLALGIAEGLNKSTDSLSNLKSCNALIYAIAARQAKTNKWNDALICNTDGNIIESTIANIFWIKGEKVYTPPLAEGCIAGIMRRYVMEQSGNVTEQRLTLAALLEADEVFLTNAIKRIKWVGSINDKTYTNTMTQKIYNQCFASK
jgi:branched-chain amino acid aminotransferase